MAEITNWVKKIWKNRTTEFPTRRTLMKEDGSSEIVTVTRNEGTVSEEGDAFDADTMNNLEERIDAGFASVNGKLIEIEKISFAINKSVTTQNSKVATMYTATQRCIVIISAVQQIANVSPKETTIYHSNHNTYIRNVGLTTATLCCHLEAGESVELYASANTEGINYFTARGIAIKI